MQHDASQARRCKLSSHLTSIARSKTQDRVLLEVKARVQANIESTIWAQILKDVNEITGGAYQTPFLQKMAKELEAKGGLEALQVATPKSDDSDAEVVQGSGDGDDEVAAEEGSSDTVKAEDGAEE